jgi:hypothetical protein
MFVLVKKLVMLAMYIHTVYVSTPIFWQYDKSDWCNVNHPDVDSIGVQFKSQLWHGLTWQVIMVFSAPTGSYWDSALVRSWLLWKSLPNLIRQSSSHLLMYSLRHWQQHKLNYKMNVFMKLSKNSVPLEITLWQDMKWKMDGSYDRSFRYLFPVKYFSEVNIMSVLWMEINVFSSSVYCIRPLAFHKASCRNLAII